MEDKRYVWVTKWHIVDNDSKIDNLVFGSEKAAKKYIEGTDKNLVYNERDECYYHKKIAHRWCIAEIDKQIIG